MVQVLRTGTAHPLSRRLGWAALVLGALAIPVSAGSLHPLALTVAVAAVLLGLAAQAVACSRCNGILGILFGGAALLVVYMSTQAVHEVELPLAAQGAALQPTNDRL